MEIKDLWGFACEVFTPPPSSSCSLNLGELYELSQALTSCTGKGSVACLQGRRGCGKAGTLIIVQCLSFPTCEMQQMSQCKDEEKPAAYRLERFEQPLMPDSPLWPYPESREHGCKETCSVPAVPEAAAGHGAGREQGSAQRCSSGSPQAAAVGWEGEICH